METFTFASAVRGYHGRFPFTKYFGKFPLGIFILEESVPFVTSPIHLQAPLRRFTKKPDVLLFSRTHLCSLLSHQTNAYFRHVCVKICTGREHFRTDLFKIPNSDYTKLRQSSLHHLQ